MKEYQTINEIKELHNKSQLKKIFITRHEDYMIFQVYKCLNEYLGRKDESIKLHEVILSDRPRKFFVDLDAKDMDIDICDTQAEIIKQIIKVNFATQYKILLDTSNFIIVDSCGQSQGKYKYSVNIVIGQYYFLDYAEFKWFGDIVCKQYYARPDSIPNFLDQNFFNREYVDSLIMVRLPGCSKKDEYRPKIVTSKHSQDDGIITNIEDCTQLSLVAQVDRNQIHEKIKNRKNVEVTDPQIKIILDKTKHLWGEAFEYRKATEDKGNYWIEFDRLQPSDCRICNEIHHKDNSLIISTFGNSITELCRQKSCQSIRVCQIDNTIPIEVPVKQSNDSSTLEYDKMFPVNKNIYLIKAEMKMGKTKECIKYIENTKPNVVILISFRRTFASDMKTRYKGFEIYSDIKESKINLSIHPKIIIQVESLHRIEYPIPEIDLIIMDEVESIWSQFGSGNLSDYFGTINTFQNILTITKKIICMDANLAKRTVRILEFIRPNYLQEYNFYQNRYNPSADIEHIFVQRPYLYTLLIKYLKDGKNIAIMTNSIKEANELHTLIKTELGPGMRIGLYTSKTKESKKAKHFKNVDHYWIKYQCIICTPTVSAGMSFEAKHFHYVFGSFTNLSCNAETCNQMKGRVRDIIDKKIYISVQSKPETDLYPEKVDYIKMQMIYNRDKLIREARSNRIDILPFNYDLDGKAEYYNNLAYNIITENIAFDNRSRNNFLGVFIHMLKRVGTPYKIIGDNPEYLDLTLGEINHIKGQINLTKIVVRKDRIDTIVKAPILTPTEFKELKNLSKISGDLTMENHASIEKYKISSIIRMDNIDKPLVGFFTPIHLKQFNAAKYLLETIPEDQLLKDYNRRTEYMISNNKLKDATSKYYSVANILLKTIFENMPLAIKIPQIFIGTSGLEYTYGFELENWTDKVAAYWDIRKALLVQTFEGFLNFNNMPIPINLYEFGPNEYLELLKKIITKLYGLTIINGRIFGQKPVIFHYLDKQYRMGREYIPIEGMNCPSIHIRE